ncbi:MAG: GspH/FimT family protein [Candidatus Babeliales bacterium]
MSMRTGFSLLTLMLTVAAIALIATLVVTSSTHLASFLVRTDIQLLHACFQFARQQAMLYQKPVALTFDPPRHSYHCLDTTTALSRTTAIAVPSGVYGPPADPKTLIQSPITFADNRILCYPNGTVSAGAVYLMNRLTRCVYAVTIPIAHEPVMHWYRYSNYQWVACQ